MAEVNAGDLVARLRVDTSEWQRGLATAQQPLTQFGQSIAQTTRQSGATAGLTDHVWSLREVLMFRIPPWPQPQTV